MAEIAHNVLKLYMRGLPVCKGRMFDCRSRPFGKFGRLEAAGLRVRDGVSLRVEI